MNEWKTYKQVTVTDISLTLYYLTRLMWCYQTVSEFNLFLHHTNVPVISVAPFSIVPFCHHTVTSNCCTIQSIS
jgi:hypothetical protein